MKLVLSVFIILFASCKTQQKIETNTENSPIINNSPLALVYKTRGNYNNLVPVILSDDKTTILSYPHPKDIIKGNQLMVPLELEYHYLLDNRGINKNVAFLNMTYEEYAQLENPLDISTLFNLIIDKDPLTELCNCGKKDSFKNEAKQINQLIKKKQIRTKCEIIK
jgi:hypothetical protein